MYYRGGASLKETFMWNNAKTFLALALLTAVAACNQDRPHEYGQQRPDVDSLDDRDRGLQSKDVVAASDQMARDLLADQELRRSTTQWTMVTDQLEDHTLDSRFNTNYDIFIQRLRTNLGIYGKGQVQLIETKRKINSLRSKELDGPADDFGQGTGPRPLSRIQPDYALHGKVYDLPNRGTNFYLLQFDVTSLKTGAIVWSGKYEVKVAR
jgi:hypothetical protein